MLRERALSHSRHLARQHRAVPAWGIVGLVLHPASPIATCRSRALPIHRRRDVGDGVPVLARILTDRGMQKTQLGVIAFGVAATDDVTAWCCSPSSSESQAKVGGASSSCS